MEPIVHITLQNYTVRQKRTGFSDKKAFSDALIVIILPLVRRFLTEKRNFALDNSEAKL